MPYEDVWHEFPAPPKGSVSWIFRNHDNETGTTFLGKLENAYLAFRKTPDESFTALREDRDAESGDWKVKYLIGSGNLPSMNAVASCKPDDVARKSLVNILGIDYHVCAATVKGNG